jgi:hypothetical protein
LNDKIFEEDRNPTPEEWRENQGFNNIYTNGCELLAKFFPPKHEPDPKLEEVLY